MEMKYTPKRIVFNKNFRAIDEFVFSFIPYLEKAHIKFVLISGYVVLFFGRDRSTEDVDLFVEDLSYERFLSFWKIVSEEFECLNTRNPPHAYENFKNGIALRFHKKGAFIPNIEFKPLKTILDRYSLENRIEVECNGRIIYISDLELQVAFKLELGSDKDKEDARFLYKLFKEHLNKSLLKEMLEKLHVSSSKFENAMGEKLE